MNHLYHFAATTTASDEGFFGVLGVDWIGLLIQVGAFLVLLFVLAKFVYPPLTRMLDARDERVEAAAKAAAENEQRAREMQQEVAQMLRQARSDADAIVETAKKEAEVASNRSDERARARAERIIEDARAELVKDVEAARRALYDETLRLVTEATGKVVGGTMTDTLDEAVVRAAIKEAQ